MAFLMRETTETEVVFDKEETLPNHENSANPEIKYVLLWVKGLMRSTVISDTLTTRST